jgi:hypothetical protein
MKGFALLMAGLLGAGLIYAATASGTGQASPSRAEFNTLKRQVAALTARQNADAKTLKSVNSMVSLCFKRAVPIGRYGGFINQRADGTVIRANALDVVDSFSGGVPQLYALDVGQECALALTLSNPPRITAQTMRR